MMSSRTGGGSDGIGYCKECNTWHLESGFCHARLAKGETDVTEGRTKSLRVVIRTLRKKLLGARAREADDAE
jgi:hypothetical protein